MGQMVDGRWQAGEVGAEADGRFARRPSVFRNWITADGSPGPSGSGGQEAESGRYHLTVSLACPWAHRTLIVRALKGLEPHVSLAVVNPLMGERGWTFAPDRGVVPDPIMGAATLSDLYARADPHYTGKVTVPVLWDRERATIVSNESAEIIRMFDGAFEAVGASTDDLYPADLRPEIDAVNERVYATVNNGVYRAGFARSQAAYEEAYRELFASLDWLDERLGRTRYLCGERLTEADIRLFTTLVRFDAVYHGHFKCNRQRLTEFANLWAYTRDIAQMPAVRATIDLDHIKRHYYGSHRALNPSGIVPAGPALDLDSPHGRG